VVAVRLSTSAKTALKSLWTDFESYFGKLLEQFREHKAYVEDEAKAAAMKDTSSRFESLEIRAEGTITAVL
jgi:hypothetical protein